MSQMSANHPDPADKESLEDLERLILEGVGDQEHTVCGQASSLSRPSHGEEDEGDEEGVSPTGDLQGALGLFAEAAQDAATASVELGLGRHFACADYCNQVAEKSAQAVSLLRFGRRQMYDHDLRALGERVGAPPDIQDELAALTPFHPEAFYVDTPPEQADEVISAAAAGIYLSYARHILRWARSIVLNA